MLMSMRSRTITASRRASCGLAGSTSFGSGPSRRGSLAGVSPRSGAAGEAAAAAAAAPFPEFEADVELQMPPLAVSPSGEICVQERSESPTITCMRHPLTSRSALHLHALPPLTASHRGGAFQASPRICDRTTLPMG